MLCLFFVCRRCCCCHYTYAPNEGTKRRRGGLTKEGALKYLAARLVVVLAGADGADLLADVVGELELLGRDEALALRLGRRDVLLLLLVRLLALGREVGRVDDRVERPRDVNEAQPKKESFGY